ncbi:hypothetical protein C0Q70_08158 [Pomacea canaliculata]|uniref:Uncharacterized protein n=1 Tax=Pomacea canaliculata TaxID=400727 RepID=A0A2T7PH04_POMCA|nr:hypothetical protein C0Q70_08158 [Pomacea canaliculata]
MAPLNDSLLSAILPDNWTSHTVEAASPKVSGDVVQGALLVAIALLGICMNLFLLLAILPNPRMRSVRQVLLVHLGFVGLVTSLVLTLPAGVLQLVFAVSYTPHTRDVSSDVKIVSTVTASMPGLSESHNVLREAPVGFLESDIALEETSNLLEDVRGLQGGWCTAVGVAGVLLTSAGVWTVAALAWDKHRAIAAPSAPPACGQATDHDGVAGFLVGGGRGLGAAPRDGRWRLPLRSGPVDVQPARRQRTRALALPAGGAAGRGSAAGADALLLRPHLPHRARAKLAYRRHYAPHGHAHPGADRSASGAFGQQRYAASRNASHGYHRSAGRLLRGQLRPVGGAAVSPGHHGSSSCGSSCVHGCGASARRAAYCCHGVRTAQQQPANFLFFASSPAACNGCVTSDDADVLASSRSPGTPPLCTLVRSHPEWSGLGGDGGGAAATAAGMRRTCSLQAPGRHGEQLKLDDIALPRPHSYNVLTPREHPRIDETVT